MEKKKKLKYNCIVCELHPFEVFVAFEPYDPIFETQEEWESRRKSHVRSLFNSAAQKDMSWKLCRKHQEQLQSYLMENHADEIVNQENEHAKRRPSASQGEEVERVPAVSPIHEEIEDEGNGGYDRPNENNV